MAWRIHSWDASTNTGEVVSSHFGPWTIEGSPGDAFAVGEDVLVELVGEPRAYRVTNVRHARQPQPEGTRLPMFDELNATLFVDCYVVDEQPERALKLWFGDCCRACGPSWHVTFRDVTLIKGLSEHGDVDAPHFRLASEAERREHGLVGNAYCIVTAHGYGPDGPPIFVVARTVEIEALDVVPMTSGR
jgi:hypothetical protein